MKALTLVEYGENARFEMADLPMPDVAAGQVLVKVAASSVNTVDTMIRLLGQENLPFAPALPAVLGMDFAGTIEAVGVGVTSYEVGDEVYGCAGGLADLQGAMAEYMPVDVRLIASKSKSLSMREAAALPLVAITAYEGLTRAGIRAGQKVLVQGGAGGVGHVAIQLARHFGAEVYATGTGEAQLDAIAGYGATPIDFKSESVGEYVAKYTDGAGFDVIFDTVGGANMTTSFEAAALNANIASTVALLELDLSPAHFKGLSLHVVFMLLPMLHNKGREAHGDILSKLADIADAGALKPLMDTQSFALEQAGAAYDRLASGQALGKVVVDV